MSKRGRRVHPPSPSPQASEGDSNDEEGQEFLDNLKRSQVLELNAAFDRIAGNVKNADGDDESRPASKRQKMSPGKGKGKEKHVEPQQAPGGFLLDDDDDALESGGGFMPPEDSQTLATSSRLTFGDTTDEEANAHEEKATYILLDRVPACLDALGLDGDDPSVLPIFSDAARKNEQGLSVVRRKDFMRVTAILYSQSANEREEKSKEEEEEYVKPRKVHSGGGKRRAIRLDVDEMENEIDDSDPLVLSSDDDEDEEPPPEEAEDSDPWADEDTNAGAFSKEISPPSTRRTTRSRGGMKQESSPAPSVSSSPDVNVNATKGKSKVKGGTEGKKVNESKYAINTKQKEECNRMFQQFFASSDDKGKTRVITMEDIRYVATLLNEKISDVDVIEMLEYASSTSDRTVNLDAFSKIMVDVKAV